MPTKKGTNITLTNGAIWESRGAMDVLLNYRFPIRVSHELVKLTQKLNGEIKAIDESRQVLRAKHFTNLETQKVETPKYDTPEWEKFTTTPAYEAFDAEWKELLAMEVKMNFTKVKLPETVAATCDKCHTNMDRPLEIEPAVLLALDEFIEV